MYCTIEFGREVVVVSCGGMIRTHYTSKVCRTITEARELKALYGGKIFRTNTDIEVE